MDGNQSFVMESFDDGDISWFPAGRSLMLERAAEREKKRRMAEAGGEEIDFISAKVVRNKRKQLCVLCRRCVCVVVG